MDYFRDKIFIVYNKFTLESLAIKNPVFGDMGISSAI